jgi:hypothetical protein
MLILKRYSVTSLKQTGWRNRSIFLTSLFGWKDEEIMEDLVYVGGAVAQVRISFIAAVIALMLRCTVGSVWFSSMKKTPSTGFRYVKSTLQI